MQGRTKIRRGLVCALLIVFTYQFYVALQKLLDPQVVTTSTNEVFPKDGIFYPSITLCPVTAPPRWPFPLPPDPEAFLLQIKDVADLVENSTAREIVLGHIYQGDFYSHFTGIET